MEESLESGLRAKDVFTTLGDELRLFQVLNNLQTPLLEMYVKEKKAHWLDVSMKHVEEMIEMLGEPSKGKILVGQLGLDGKKFGSVGRKVMVRKHHEQLRLLQQVKNGVLKIELTFSTMHTTTIATFAKA